MCRNCVDAHRGQERGLDPLELELQAVGGRLMRVLEIGLL